MPTVNKPLLRSVLKNLRAVPFDRRDYSNCMIAPQEMLDFLAMMAGIKPVYLLGRGFDDPPWVKGVIAIADKMGLHIINGPEWNACPDAHEYPAWFGRASAKRPCSTSPERGVMRVLWTPPSRTHPSL